MRQEAHREGPFLIATLSVLELHLHHGGAARGASGPRVARSPSRYRTQRRASSLEVWASAPSLSRCQRAGTAAFLAERELDQLHLMPPEGAVSRWAKRPRGRG